MQRALIITGVMLLLAGVLWPWIQKMGLGRLPGDVVIERENFRLYLPFTTMLLVSVIVTVILWLFRK